MLGWHFDPPWPVSSPPELWQNCLMICIKTLSLSDPRLSNLFLFGRCSVLHWLAWTLLSQWPWLVLHETIYFCPSLPQHPIFSIPFLNFLLLCHCIMLPCVRANELVACRPEPVQVRAAHLPINSNNELFNLRLTVHTRNFAILCCPFTTKESRAPPDDTTVNQRDQLHIQTCHSQRRRDVRLMVKIENFITTGQITMHTYKMHRSIIACRFLSLHLNLIFLP